ncbi:hypothetical protein ENSA5_59090 [Enhygromyxa salina]|uniref:Uncharacterized protein n=1 Tax=Enhygromyxa salina TaxID=215803 RepID=A0A2S9XE75_9BACT|nr:hypothetical protein [Enhygromyxa salina]PRP91060.1 hypothetical protein ENSA5_59090 [Enhygromyxa salina]
MRDTPRLVGIYEAEGTLLGELRYVVGKALGRRHCALCDITHGSVRKKPEFVALEQRLGLPISLLHLDERSPEQRSASEGRTPCVLIDDGVRLQILLGADELETCGGSVERFEQLLTAALARQRPDVRTDGSPP